MAYQTALTIESVIKDIDSKKYLLPSIQREFVWSTKQIEKLFDSLMMDYPINAFLFWKVPKEKAKEFSFYEFLRDYHQRTGRHNPKANISGSDDIIAILDGQQRMTSLYIGLKGSYAYKISHKRWDNPQAYPARKLYVIDFNQYRMADRIRNKAINEGNPISDAQVIAKVKDMVDDLRLRMPFQLSIERDEEDKEKLTITSITDRNGNDLADSMIEINIQSLGADERYWLDTGAFEIQ